MKYMQQNGCLLLRFMFANQGKPESIAVSPVFSQKILRFVDSPCTRFLHITAGQFVVTLAENKQPLGDYRSRHRSVEF
jgi:hypothetical protein